MAYKSKNLSVQRKRVAQSKAAVRDSVDVSMQNLQIFTDSMKKVAETEKITDQIGGAAPLIQYMNKRRKSNMADYETHRSAFDKILAAKQQKNPNVSFEFPDFKTYNKGGFKATIGDQAYNKTALNYSASGMTDDLLEAILRRK